MSTHTVYGCYIASTGKFEFSDTVCTEATITGCLVKEGEHAGQVEITHDYGGCETQYYACYDPATGKFEFEADDGCCEPEGCEACAYEPTYYSCVPDACYDLADCIPKYQLVTCSGFSAPCEEVNGEWILHCYNDNYKHKWGGGDVYTNLVLTTNTQQTTITIVDGSDTCIDKTDTAQKCVIEGTITDSGKTVTWEPCDESGNPCTVPIEADDFIEVTISGVSSYDALWYEPDGCYYGPSNCSWVNDTFILERTSRFSLVWRYSDVSGHIVELALGYGGGMYTALEAKWGPPSYGDPESPPTPWCDLQEGAYYMCFGWGNYPSTGPCLTAATSKENACPDYGDCSWDYYSPPCGGCAGTASWEVI